MKRKLAIAAAVMLLAAACAGRPTPPRSTISPGTGSFDSVFERGLLFLARGEYDQASRQFQAALEAKPDSVKARNYLGICYFRLKKYEPAREQFEKAIAADPSFASAYNNLAGICSIKSEFPKAEELYKKALALSPDLISANYSLGILLCNLGRYDQGSIYLERGIALDPEYLGTHAELVTTFSSLSFDTRQTYFAYARAFAAQGNVEKTVEYLGKARQAGFADWSRILHDAEFEKVRDDPRIKAFLKSQRP